MLNVNYALQKFQKGKKKQLHETKYDFVGGHFSAFLLKQGLNPEHAGESQNHTPNQTTKTEKW